MLVYTLVYATVYAKYDIIYACILAEKYKL